MTNTMQNFRYIEHEYDYTFRYYPNGTVQIFDNENQVTIKPKELSGAPLAFYARKNLQWIKGKLKEGSRNEAG